MHISVDYRLDFCRLLLLVSEDEDEEMSTFCSPFRMVSTASQNMAKRLACVGSPSPSYVTAYRPVNVK